MNDIEISVVMPVFNEEESLEKTVQSVLKQNGVNFELIIIDDGSVDNSGEILDRFAQSDDRITVISQVNQGITQALVNGCRLAKGRFIARQDAGDWSLPGRLEKQLDVFIRRPEVVLCSTGSRYFSERGELLFVATLTEDEANDGLQSESLEGIKGPSHHGCTMFRRSSYEACGGYRTSFFVAQDLDLWTRLSDLGKHVALTDIYYEAVLRKNAISSKKRRVQELARQHIFECSQLRKTAGNDASHVELLEEKTSKLASQETDPELEYNYFVGSILLNNKPGESRHYFRAVIKAKLWHLKSWLKLLQSYFS